RGRTRSRSERRVISEPRTPVLGVRKPIEPGRQTMAATNRAKNDLQRVKGKTKEAVGEATGNRRLERKGKVDQAKGKARTWARSSRTQSAASSPLARVPQRAPRRTGTPPRISRRPDSQEL